jgi:cytoskeletal protein RodZ
MGYPVGRIVIENMRTDSANHILGQRVNTWVSLLVFLLGLWLWFHFARMAREEAEAGSPAPEAGEADEPGQSVTDSGEQDEESEQPEPGEASERTDAAAQADGVGPKAER